VFPGAIGSGGQSGFPFSQWDPKFSSENQSTVWYNARTEDGGSEV